MNIAICFSARIFQKPQISPNCLDVLRAAMVRSFSDGNAKRTKHFVDDVMYVSGNKQVHHIQPTRHPAWGRGTPSAFAPPLFIHFIIFCSLLLFPFFLFSFTLLIFFYCPSDPFLPESSHSVSRREVVGGDRTWV